nr:hypothetical protein [Halomarina salina]
MRGSSFHDATDGRPTGCVSVVSSRTLRLVAELAEESEEAYRPTVVDGVVVYRSAERILSDDERPHEALEALAERGILDRTFDGKVYLCPECESEEMTFTTACPDCGSTHVVEREFIECEGCDRAAPAAAFERDDSEIVCHECNSTMTADSVERSRQYVCEACGEDTELPLNALQCTADEFLSAPTEAIERVLYSYELGANGQEWLEEQLRARRVVAEELASRGYNVEEEATVTGRSGTDHHLHVHAADDLLGERLVATVHELPLTEDVVGLIDAAADLDARPILVSTLGTVSVEVADRAEREEVTILTVDDDGTVSRSYEVTEDLTDAPSFIERITTALR